MASASPSRYVPPHLRNRAPAPPASPSGPPSGPSAGPSSAPPAPSDSPRRARQPWSHASAFHPPARSADWAYADPRRGPEPAAPAASSSAAAPPARAPRASAPALYVFGDSFVGPFKLLRDDCARVQTFKGASAKGLDNPKSIKQVSAELVPILDGLLAPPPYAYVPPAGRTALLIFGNINYLYQLQHKPICAETFTDDERAAAPAPIASAASAEAADDVDGAGGTDDGHTPEEHILATATETSLRGPAFGPTRFVDAVLRAYTAWLAREVVGGPVGARIRDARAQADGADAGPGSAPRRRGPTRVLVAGALPPLVDDDTLFRIPEKYVERLEEDHARAQRALDAADKRDGADDAGGSRTPWAVRAPSPAAGETQGAGSDGTSTAGATDAVGPGPAAAALPTGEPARADAAAETASAAATAAKASIAALLGHVPALCTKPVRAAMTRRFNAGLRAFCDASGGVVQYVDVTAAMLAEDAGGEGGEHGGAGAASDADDADADVGEPATATASAPADPADPAAGASLVDRATWACPVDPSNIHPLWEPTLPLWLRELAAAGVPTQRFAISEDAEETFRAYEADKRRRTEGKEFAPGEAGAGGVGGDGAGAAGGAGRAGEGGPEVAAAVERLKLRDE